MPGPITSGAVVTKVLYHCVWILIGDEELAFPYFKFPWFKAATIQQIPNVPGPTTDHLYWPDLDVELSVELVRHSERFPLKAMRTLQPCHSPETPPEIH